MKTLWNNSNYNNDLRMTRRDAEFCSQSGDMENNVRQTMKKPYIKKQLESLNAKDLQKELKEHSFEDISDLEVNLIRWVWLSACDISERINS